MAYIRKWLKISVLSLMAFLSFMGSQAQAELGPRCQAVFAVSEGKPSVIKEVIDQNLLNDVVVETIEGHGNITSRYTINQTEALTLGEKWMGPEYSEIGKTGSGVFLSADKRRRFRIDNNSVLGNHAPHRPHVHLELVDPITGYVITNNHIVLNAL